MSIRDRYDIFEAVYVYQYHFYDTNLRRKSDKKMIGLYAQNIEELREAFPELKITFRNASCFYKMFDFSEMQKRQRELVDRLLATKDIYIKEE